MAVALAEEPPLTSHRGHLFLVADGMGAHAAGELASQIAADNIPHIYHKQSDSPPATALADALHDANAKIHAKGQHSVDFQGMGTTCSCLALLPEGALVGHVGDSRVYRLRDDAIEQLTFDHSLVWEMALAGQASEDEVPAYVPKNVITRSLGPNSNVKVDIEGPLEVLPGDVYLLCSDGLSGPLKSELIGIVLGALPAEEAAQTLVDLANLLGGPDNITVIVVQIDDSGMPDSSVKRSVGNATSTLLDRDARNAYWPLLALAVANALAGGLLLLGGVAGWIGAAAFAVGLLLWFVWYLASLRETDAPEETPAAHSLQGKAPYRRYEIRPGANNIDRLSDIVRQLEDLESQRTWNFDWTEIHADRGRAHQAIAAGDFREATIAYCRAVRRMMQAVRDSGPDPSSDSSIQLGQE